jgi:hypothetical protein
MARTPERIPKENTPSNRGFGIAWLLFAIGLGFHVADEATHNFLSTYNPSVRAIRARFPFLPLPTFTFAVWLTLLIVGIFSCSASRHWPFAEAAGFAPFRSP